MKKFYYSKENSQDESPNFLSMDHRRNTISVDNEQGRSMSARAASVNSLDLLSEAPSPSIPRVKTRDVTRSMSDVAAKSQSKQKLFTETELSSSWLYKTMQESINARFKSPRKSPCVHKTGDLEQSILRDPELKPLPMKSKAAKTSSCICHFATMIAISLCTIGFLASIAAIIYMEIFADRNITSLHAAEAEFDLSDVVMDSLEAYNLTTHDIEGEEHILKEALTHKFDGDEDILNEALKSSSTNDIPGLSSKNSTHEQFDYVTDESKPQISDLNDTNSKIKFQDGVTVIYEMKPEESKDDADLDFSDENKGRNFDLDQTEDKPVGFFRKLPVNDEKEQESSVPKETEEAILNDSTLLDNSEIIDKKSQGFTLNEFQLKDLKETASEKESKSKNVPESLEIDKLEENESTERISADVAFSPEDFNSDRSQNVQFEKTPNLDTNDVMRGSYIIDYTSKSDKHSGSSSEIFEDSTILTNLSESEIVQVEDKVYQSTPESDKVADDHDVNTMVVTIDDTEVSTDSVMSNRNGEINVFQVSSPVPIVDPVKQINTNISKKPVDIKVSLADAMKHLQKLDVNNKILSSRTKSKQSNIQKPKRRPVSNKNKEEERLRYLHHMRMMLFKQML